MIVISSNPFGNPSNVTGYEAWYQKAGRRAERREIALLTWLLSRFPQPHSLLEVGCGTGHFTRWFSSVGINAVGLDLSMLMLQEAKKHNKVIYIQGNAGVLPFLSKSFDLVSMITTLEFLSEPEEALKEAKRIARKGLILGVINERSRLGRQYKRKGGPIWETARLFNVDELINIVRKVSGAKNRLFWRTTLWPCWPGALALPRGGFIGAAVLWQSEGDE